MVPVLIKRSADTNSFISITADATIRQLIVRATLNRCLSALLPCCATRHTEMRRRAAAYTLEWVAEMTDMVIITFVKWRIIRRGGGSGRLRAWRGRE